MLHYLPDQDTIHAEKEWVTMCEFCTADLMCLIIWIIGHGIEARTLTRAEITYFPSRCITSAWKAPSQQPHASQALMIHLVGKYAILAWVWVLAIFLIRPPMATGGPVVAGWHHVQGTKHMSWPEVNVQGPWKIQESVMFYPRTST